MRHQALLKLGVRLLTTRICHSPAAPMQRHVLNVRRFVAMLFCTGFIACGAHATEPSQSDAPRQSCWESEKEPGDLFDAIALMLALDAHRIRALSMPQDEFRRQESQTIRSCLQKWHQDLLSPLWKSCGDEIFL